MNYSLVFSLLLIFCILFLCFIYSTWSPCEYSREEERYLFGWMFTLDANAGGIGNNMFEFMSFIGIARMIQRVPVLSADAARHLRKSHSEFPFLLDGIKIGKLAKRSANVTFSHRCCEFADPVTVFAPYQVTATVNIRLVYSQSFKYFANFSREEITKKLTMTGEIQRIAREDVVPLPVLRSADNIICIHSRRGDFVTSTLHAHSNEDFTLPATKLLIERARKRGSKKPLIVFIGDDKPWQRDLVKKLPNVTAVVANEGNSKMPSVVDWEFSRQHCDSLLLSASASTFGWWMGYLSKRNDVYYNTVFSKPNGFGNTLVPEDFFPLTWVPLEYDTSTHSVAIRPPFL